MPRNKKETKKETKVMSETQKERKRPVRKQDKAAIEFPVGRIGRHLRKNSYFTRISEGASIYIAAALQHIINDILDLAVEVVNDDGRKRIIPGHILRGIIEDEEIKSLFKNALIFEGGRDAIGRVGKRKRLRKGNSQSQSQMDASQAA